MKRGWLVTVALSGDYGKPRPALVTQSDYFSDHPSVTLLPATRAIRDTPLFRVTVEANTTNNLRATSQVMVDKAMTIPRDKVEDEVGSLNRDAMTEVDRCLALFLGIAD